MSGSEGDLLDGSGEVTWPFQLQSQPFTVMLFYKCRGRWRKKTRGYNLACESDVGSKLHGDLALVVVITPC